jgi:hypothetical protein
VKDYGKTLDSVEQIITKKQPKLMIPGHGDVCSDTHEMFLRLKESREYLDALQDAVASGNGFREDRLWDRYDFRDVQAEYHRKNVELMQQEYESARPPLLGTG